MFLGRTFQGSLLCRTLPAPKQAEVVQMVPEECPDAPQARDAKQHPREPPPGVYEQSRLLEGDTGAGATAAQQATQLAFHVAARFRP